MFHVASEASHAVIGRRKKRKVLPASTLKQTLNQLGRDHFYLMHLSYGQSDRADRRPLWEFARKHRLIGMDRGIIDRPWPETSGRVRMELTPTWRYQFQAFSSMQPDDCVMIVDGITDLLGVARVTGAYEFKSKLYDDFYRHVRKVEWLVAYNYDKRKPDEFGGFLSTLVRVEEGSPFWGKTRTRLSQVTRMSRLARRRIARDQEELRRKYGQGGEGNDHRRLKAWVRDHPEKLGLEDAIDHEVEHRFQTGDRADVVFHIQGGRFAVVEVETVDTFTGARQALKYKALKCMEMGLDIWSNRVEPILVAWRSPGPDRFCERYGVRFIQKRI